MVTKEKAESIVLQSQGKALIEEGEELGMGHDAIALRIMQAGLSADGQDLLTKCIWNDAHEKALKQLGEKV